MVAPQFTVYTHAMGPNPWKVVIVLNELGLDYETIELAFNDSETGVKNPKYLKHCPNGRVPALIDHGNNDYTIWESCAIMQYLVDRYDKSHKISIPHSDPEFHQMLQYLYFQATGQGVIAGQAVWFGWLHHEPVESAAVRYRKETKRVLGVLEDILQDQEYLMGSKCTIADLAFVPWYELLDLRVLSEENGKGLKDLPTVNLAKEYPRVHDWNERLLARPAVSKSSAEKRKAMGK